MKMKKFLALFLSLAMLFALTACGGGNDTPPADDGNNDQQEPADSGSDGGEKTAQDLKLAVILKTQATDFWVKMHDGAEQYAADNGLQVELFAAQSDTDYEGQLAILETCLNNGGYDGIVIAPCSGVNMISGVKAANDAGVTIVNLDEQFDPAEMESRSASCVAFTSSDNVSIGHLGAAHLCSLLEEGSQVAVIEGIAGNPSSEDRASGAKAAFEEGKMEIIGAKSCDWDMQTALDTAATWISQYPDLKAIYCCNDGMAMGAMQAIANAGKTGEILLCGTDGDSDAVKAVADGNMTATVAQDPAGMGAKALELLVDACLNPASYPASSAPDKTPVDAILVTVDNAASMG